MNWQDEIKYMRVQLDQHTIVEFTNGSRTCSCGLERGETPNLRRMKIEQPLAGDQLYDLLDQVPERIAIITGNVIVARYKGYTVKFRDYEVFKEAD